MKKSFKERITSLGLSYSKEMTILSLLIVLIMGLGVLAYWYYRAIFVLGIALLIMVLFIYMYFSRYKMLEKKLEQDHVNELISLLSYFEIFVANGNNIYMSFKLLIPYASTYMEEAINSLLNQIDMDKSVTPFITFAHKFTNRTIESLMLSIYQMVELGSNSNQFSEFNLIFSNVNRDHQEKIIDHKKKTLDVLNSFPLFGAGAITIILSISILSLIGDMVNVL